MKVLLMSVKAGYGHHSAAQSLIDCFKSHGLECEMLDTLSYFNKFIGNAVDRSYLFLTKYVKRPYGKVYTHLDKRVKPYGKCSFTSALFNIVAKRIKKYIKEYNPDFIIATHSFAAVIMTILKDNGIITCPTFGIVTDFTIHPYWEITKLDYYITPDLLLNAAAEKKGIKKEKILPLGIPVKKQFSYKASKKEMRFKLGLSDKTTIMVMMGSMGFGSLKDIIRELDEYPSDFQIVCICANNKKMYKKISTESWQKEVHTLGFIKNVDEYMDASDIIITKPGGLTTSEALAKKLPLILTSPIPGQEDRNIEFLVNSGVALSITKTFPLNNALSQFFDSSWRQEHIKIAVEHIGKPNSAEALYKIIEGMII